MLKLKVHYNPKIYLNRYGNTHGKCKFFNECGNVSMEGYCIDGKYIGICKDYYGSGIVCRLTSFKPRGINGIKIFFSTKEQPCIFELMELNSGK